MALECLAVQASHTSLIGSVRRLRSGRMRGQRRLISGYCIGLHGTQFRGVDLLPLGFVVNVANVFAFAEENLVGLQRAACCGAHECT